MRRRSPKQLNNRVYSKIDFTTIVYFKRPTSPCFRSSLLWIVMSYYKLLMLNWMRTIHTWCWEKLITTHTICYHSNKISLSYGIFEFNIQKNILNMSLSSLVAKIWVFLVLKSCMVSDGCHVNHWLGIWLPIFIWTTTIYFVRFTLPCFRKGMFWLVLPIRNWSFWNEFDTCV